MFFDLLQDGTGGFGGGSGGGGGRQERGTKIFREPLLADLVKRSETDTKQYKEIVELVHWDSELVLDMSLDRLHTNTHLIIIFILYSAYIHNIHTALHMTSLKLQYN